ncbi:MAG: dTDP-4-dehydrorhamnose reductase [Deltaproteobacteria bacterium]|nr:dTDP-4-dehydrorhamnose reductase [Deltaproteobacteria bacterium]
MLGREILREWGGLGHEIVAPQPSECDVRIAGDVERVTALVQPGIVVNAAAWTDVDGAESRPDDAFLVNALGAENVAAAAAGVGAVVLHVSTDFVFDGRAGRPYDEFDDPCPLTLYGRSKLAGERLVARVAPRHFVVRTAYLYGRGGRNFGSTLLAGIRGGETIRADATRRVAPTWTRAMARQCLRIVGTERYGVWHAASAGETTWVGFAQAMAGRLGRDARIVAADTRALGLAAPRPDCSLLEGRMARLTRIPPMPAWNLALDEYLESEGSEAG